jgi:hypothetical protein
MFRHKDYNYGTSSERELQPHLEKLVGRSLRPLDRFNSFDFKGKNCLVELKTRRIDSKRYPTAPINCSKVEKAKIKIKNGYDVYFCFKYTDGLFYLKYEGEELTYNPCWGRQDRGIDERKAFYMIDIDKMKEFSY